jgi:hypothetical protein
VNNSAIQRVTDAIRARLNEALGNAPDSDLVFIGPLHDTGADDAFMVLFLYRVVPNPDLRNTRHVAPANNPADPPVAYENAMPLDLYYILTAGGREDGGERDSLLRLGQAIQALNERPLFAGSGLDNEIVRLTMVPATSDEMSRVWALFPDQNFRTSILYLASPVWIDPLAAIKPATPVLDSPHRLLPKSAGRMN